jgi:phosphatidylglycerol:prolipoprotein diacylglycerol transferase|tara:strand:+ start:29 stop:817 length:789 start_codon:yes stop_codon:yes gene_type:complete
MKYFVIDPVILDLGFVQIYWYGVMYLLAFLAAYLLAKYRVKSSPLWNTGHVDDLIFYGALGAVLGGRFGYLLFYNFSIFTANPLTFFNFQNGGMSFHGGFLGVLIAMILFNRKSKFSFFQTTDFIAPLVPLGLAFGRIGNYINGELWGKITESSWGVYAPDQSGIWAQRYPTQLYEAFLEGIILFAILWFFSKKNPPIRSTSALFLIFYGAFRFIIEFIRVPDSHLGYLAFEWLTMGQALSLPMILIGLYLFYKSYYIKGQS